MIQSANKQIMQELSILRLVTATSSQGKGRKSLKRDEGFIWNLVSVREIIEDIKNFYMIWSSCYCTILWVSFSLDTVCYALYTQWVTKNRTLHSCSFITSPNTDRFTYFFPAVIAIAWDHRPSIKSVRWSTYLNANLLDLSRQISGCRAILTSVQFIT